MREISPATGATADEFLSMMPSASRALVASIRAEKRSDARPYPSRKLIDKSSVLSAKTRSSLLDMVARLTDENLFGRSEMCIQFAVLLHRALGELGIDSRVALGTAMYFENGREIFRWEHAWVRVGSEVIDGNTDILYENPFVPKSVCIPPYWGSVTDVPGDRRLREGNTALALEDVDVDNIWWPELQASMQSLKSK